MTSVRIFWSLSNPAECRYFCLTENRDRIIPHLLDLGNSFWECKIFLANNVPGK